MRCLPFMVGTGVALLGCGSGSSVTPLQPGPEIQGRLVPADATVAIGATVELTLELTGSSIGLSVEWTCETEAENLAAAENTERGCLIGGKDAGVVPIAARLRTPTRMGRAVTQVTVVPLP